MAIRLKPKTGYSAETYVDIFGSKNPYFLSGSNGLETRNKFVDGHVTNEPEKIVGEFYYPGMGVVNVKFPANMTAPVLEDMARVEFENAEAIVIKNDVYVKADKVRVVA